MPHADYYADEKLKTAGKMLVWIVAIAVLVGGYLGVDEGGWIPHSKTIQVDFPAHDWQVGEYVDCYATKLDRDAPVILACNGGAIAANYREMDVKFWGVVTPSKDGIPFKCQRETNSITCHKPD